MVPGTYSMPADWQVCHSEDTLRELALRQAHIPIRFTLRPGRCPSHMQYKGDAHTTCNPNARESAEKAAQWLVAMSDPRIWALEVWIWMVSHCCGSSRLRLERLEAEVVTGDEDLGCYATVLDMASSLEH